MANSPNNHRNILLAVSGSIAAYKAADVVSLLMKQGHSVRCLMTRSASQFVTPTVLETLSGAPVHSELFGPGISGTEHIRLARWADIMLFAPATANLIAKLALGLADDLVTTVALATRAPWLIAPAMNTVMWEQNITQANIQTLRDRGVQFIEPVTGVLACGEEGAGKLAPPEQVVETTLRALSGLPPGAPREQPKAVPDQTTVPQDLRGLSVLITAGPTISPIDAVRYITNHSTGKMGAALAEAALARGAEVYYILGIDKGVEPPAPHARLHLTKVRTAEEMAKAALEWLPGVHGVIAAAAVLDYNVKGGATHKTKRASEPVSLELIPSTDVLQTLRSHARPGQWFLGFAAETDQVETYGAEKLKKKGLDYLFANRVARVGEETQTGFGTSTNAGVLLRSGDRPKVELPLASKHEIAARIWDTLVADGVGGGSR